MWYLKHNEQKYAFVCIINLEILYGQFCRYRLYNMCVKWSLHLSCMFQQFIEANLWYQTIRPLYMYIYIISVVTLCEFVYRFIYIFLCMLFHDVHAWNHFFSLSVRNKVVQQSWFHSFIFNFLVQYLTGVYKYK